MELIPIMPEGWLKTSQEGKSWKRRFFRVKETRLVFWKSVKDLDKSPTGFVELKGSEVKPVVGGKAFVWGVHGPSDGGKPFLMQAESATDMQRWMNALIQVSLDMVQPGSGASFRSEGSGGGSARAEPAGGEEPPAT